MFEGFEQTKDTQSRKRWFASTGTSIVIMTVLGGVGIVLASQASSAPHPEPEIDVSFQAAPEEKAKPPPPPPPPPPKATTPRAKRAGRPAPAQPTVIPEERPSEADPTGAEEAVAFEEFGDGGEGGGLVETKPPPPPPPPPPPLVEEKVPDPVSEVDPSFVAARAVAGNALPAYPEKMRHKGVEAEVLLKIRISATGEVTGVELVRGDEPFAAVAIAAVKTWKYRPAASDGRPTASTRLVKIPFRLNARS